MSGRFQFIAGLVLTLSLLSPNDSSAEVRLAAKNINVISVDAEGIALNHPTTLFYDPLYEEIYITDETKGQLVIYGADYFPKLAVGTGRGLYPVFGAFVHKNQVYACVGNSNEDKPHIVILNEALLPVKKIYFQGFNGATTFAPRKLVVAIDGTIYVVGIDPTFVVVLDAQGNFLRTIAPETKVLGVLEKATIVSLTIGRDGRLYFLSEKQSKIFVYSGKEKLLYSFGEKGGITGKLARPKGIALDEKNGFIYIVDYLRHSVSAFNLAGQFVLEFGGKGVGRGWFQYPYDVTVDGHSNVLVSDSFNNRVQVFSVDKVVENFSIAESSPAQEENQLEPKTPQAPSSTKLGKQDAQVSQPQEKPRGGAWVEGTDGKATADF